jgi:hypothetical protein
MVMKMMMMMIITMGMNIVAGDDDCWCDDC